MYIYGISAGLLVLVKRPKKTHTASIDCACVCVCVDGTEATVGLVSPRRIGGET